MTLGFYCDKTEGGKKKGSINFIRMNKIKDIVADRNAFLTKRSRRIRNESSERNCSNIHRVFQWLRAANNKRIVKAIHAPFRFRHQKTMPRCSSLAKERRPGKLTCERAREREKDKKKRRRKCGPQSMLLFALNETSLFASSLLLALIIPLFFFSSFSRKLP